MPIYVSFSDASPHELVLYNTRKTYFCMHIRTIVDIDYCSKPSTEKLTNRYFHSILAEQSRLLFAFCHFNSLFPSCSLPLTYANSLPNWWDFSGPVLPDKSFRSESSPKKRVLVHCVISCTDSILRLNRSEAILLKVENTYLQGNTHQGGLQTRLPEKWHEIESSLFWRSDPNFTTSANRTL